MKKLFILVILVMGFSFNGCTSLRSLTALSSLNKAERARGEKVKDQERYLKRRNSLLRKLIKERDPKIDKKGRYPVLIRNNSYRDVKVKIYISGAEWFGASLKAGAEVEKNLPPGRINVKVYYLGNLDVNRRYNISSIEEYDSQTKNYYTKIIEYNF